MVQLTFMGHPQQQTINITRENPGKTYSHHCPLYSIDTNTEDYSNFSFPFPDSNFSCLSIYGTHGTIHYSPSKK